MVLFSSNVLDVSFCFTTDANSGADNLMTNAAGIEGRCPAAA